MRSANSTAYNYVNPVRRDTVNIGFNNGITSDNVTVRFTTDNAGPWFLHWCANGLTVDNLLIATFTVILIGTCKGSPFTDA